MMPLALAARLVLLAAAATPAPASSEVAAAGASPPAEVEAAPPPAAPPNERTARNLVFAELFGSGLLYSVNYERVFEPWHVGLRGGASYFTYAVSSYGRSGNLVLASFPMLASYYVPWRSHNLQLGLGATVLYTGVATDSQGTAFESDRSGLGVAASGLLGYRYLPRDGGVSFGVAFTPMVRAGSFLPWGGASAGYAF
jgi:hypothetical protein